MRRYESYKDSGVEWLGEVPSHWDVQRSKFIFKKIERKVNEEDQIVTCFRDGQVTLRANRRTEGFTNALKEHGYQGIRKGDLVIHAMDAFAGAIGISDSDGKATPVYSVCLPHNKQKIDVYFYAYYLRNLALSGFISSLAKGIRERSTDFRYADFAELLLPIPPYLEQQKIAQFLDDKTAKIDQAVDLAEKQIALLKEHKQILIQNAVTRGLNPDVPLKDSGVEWIGQVPEHWEILSIKRLSQVKRGASPRPIDNPKYFDDDGEYAWVRISDVTASNMYLLETTQKLSNLGKSYSVPLMPDSLFLSIAGSVGKPIITKIKVCIHDGFVYFPEYKQNTKFLYYIFYSEQPYIGLGKMGTQLNLNTDTVGAIKIPIPPLCEQQKIADYLDTQTAKIDQAIALKTAHIEKLKEYKNVLINDVVTGKVRV
jgi:type I restriction modification DNA specificity domain protein